jgi:hypothetical protein
MTQRTTAFFAAKVILNCRQQKNGGDIGAEQIAERSATAAMRRRQTM